VAHATLNARRRSWSVAIAIILAALALAGFGLAAHSFAARRAPSALIAKARALLREGCPDLAIEVLEGIDDDQPVAVAGTARVIEGFAAIKLNDLRRARQAFERGLELEPDQPDAVRALAALYLSIGDAQRGIALLQVGARLDPHDARAWSALGTVYHELGEPEAAVSAFGEALRRDPENPEARNAWVAQLLKVHRAEQATAALEESLRRQPSDPTVLTLAARHAQELGRRAEALDYARRALLVDPHQVQARMVRAAVHLQERNFKLALDEAKQADLDDPANLKVLQVRKVCERLLGLEEQAAHTLDRERRLRASRPPIDKLLAEASRHPEDPEPRYRAGRLAALAGSPELARRCFRAALALDPQHCLARAELEALEPQTGR
jgi:tetratricopeptide (TPR) repeat protein